MPIHGPQGKNLNKIHGRGAPAHSFGRRGEGSHAVNHVGPGPGSYSPDVSVVKRGGASGYGFGRGERPEAAHSGEPGPGAYVAKSDVTKRSKGSGYSFGHSAEAKSEHGLADSAPGPGSYNPKSEFSKRGVGSGYGFGITGRFRPGSAGDTAPGPGQYSPGVKSSPSFHGPKIFTGPGHGNPSSGAMGSGSTGDVSSTPGPGHYYSKAEKPVGPGWKFGSAASPSDQPGSAFEGTPGPGHYHSTTDKSGKITSHGPNPPKTKIGGSSRFKNTKESGHDTPGPGDYSGAYGMGSGSPKYSMGTKQSVSHLRKIQEGGGDGIGDLYTQFGH